MRNEAPGHDCAYTKAPASTAARYARPYRSAKVLTYDRNPEIWQQDLIPTKTPAIDFLAGERDEEYLFITERHHLFHRPKFSLTVVPINSIISSRLISDHPFIQPKNYLSLFSNSAFETDVGISNIEKMKRQKTGLPELGIEPRTSSFHQDILLQAVRRVSDLIKRQLT